MSEKESEVRDEDRRSSKKKHKKKHHHRDESPPRSPSRKKETREGYHQKSSSHHRSASEHDTEIPSSSRSHPKIRGEDRPPPDRRPRDDQRQRDDKYNRRRSRSPIDRRGGHHDSRRNFNRRPDDRFEERTFTSGGRKRRPQKPQEAVPLHMNKKVIQHAEQIKQRKSLWQKPPEVEKKTETTWDGLMKTVDTDEGTMSKFRKLMGMKGSAANSDPESGEPGTSSGTLDENKIAEEKRKHDLLIQNLDRQYDIARISTHTFKGTGLGFASRM